ncbi:TPA: hypothetical protein ACH3X2_001215 [Trebouxia sp. C0005]
MSSRCSRHLGCEDRAHHSQLCRQAGVGGAPHSKFQGPHRHCWQAEAAAGGHSSQHRGWPIAHASVDLDMRQWKDSQTYQAEVPLANDQVGDDSKCVVIASSGLQRAAANVGAGGMLKKNLPSKHGSDLSMTEEQLVEHKRFMPLAGWISLRYNRYSRQEDGMHSTHIFPQICLLEGRTSPAPHPHPRKPLPPPPPDNHQLLAAQLQAGKEAVTQGKNSLAAKLAASPVWASLTLDAESFPSTGKQEYRPLMDWKVVIAVRLVIENQLPIKGTYFMWDTPKGWWQHGDEAERCHRQPAACAHLLGRHALQHQPAVLPGWLLQLVLVSESYSSHQAGTQGKQGLPEKFLMARAALNRDIDMEAWQIQNKICAAHIYCDR